MSRLVLRAGVPFVLAALIAPLLLAAQRTPAPPPEMRDPQFGSRRNEKSPAEEEFERRRLKKANEDRHKELQRDAEKLHQLATELKDYVEKTNENMLSVDVVRKAEEIEKLAKSVRQKMKGY